MEYTQRVLLYEDGSQLHHLGIESLVIIRPAALASDGLWKITDETASSGVLKSCINVTADNSGIEIIKDNSTWPTRTMEPFLCS